MAFTYDGGAMILKYIYSGEDTLNGFDTIEIELIESDGVTPYDSGRGLEDKVEVLMSDSVWDFTIGAVSFVTNKSDLEFNPSKNENIQTISYFNLYVSGISQTPIKLAKGELNTPININEGETPIIRAYDEIAAEGLVLKFDLDNFYTSTLEQIIFNYVFSNQETPNPMSGVIDWKFTIIDDSGITTPLSVYIAREQSNWTFPQVGSGNNAYAQARNVGELIFPLNGETPGRNILTDTLRIYFGTGFPTTTYTYAGNLSLWNLGTNQPFTYIINDGETARLQAGYLRINSK